MKSQYSRLSSWTQFFPYQTDCHIRNQLSHQQNSVTLQVLGFLSKAWDSNVSRLTSQGAIPTRNIPGRKYRSCNENEKEKQREITSPEVLFQLLRRPFSLLCATTSYNCNPHLFLVAHLSHMNKLEKDRQITYFIKILEFVLFVYLNIQSHKPIPNVCYGRIKAISYEESMKTNHFHLLWRAILKSQA